jgi:selenocysteine lyase/cysteine desulfurase
MDLSEIRAEFPILERKTYLNSCSLGALSHRAMSYLDEFQERWHAMGASAWYGHWLGRVGDLRTRVAAMLGTTPGQVALLPSTSAAFAVLQSAIEAKGRNRVICTELDFPTLVYQWRVRPDIELVMLPSHDGVRVDPEQFREVADERTLFVATSHVYFATGWIQDIAAIAKIARDVGAYSLIDGYQGPGQIVTRLPEAGVDFYTTGPLKWLCGGPGLSYLYVREPLVTQLEPTITSWFAHKDQFAFDIEHFEYHDDARRFELGTPALPTIHTALGGQEIIDEVGVEAIEARNRALTDYFVERARERGFELTTAPDPAERSAIVMLQHRDPSAAVKHLANQGVITDYRPGHVRVSPHFYNTEDDLDRCLEVLSQEIPR